MSKNNTFTRGKAIAFLLFYFLGYLTLYQCFLEPYLYRKFGSTICFVTDIVVETSLLILFLGIGWKYYVRQHQIFQQNTKRNWLFVIESFACLLITNILLSDFISMFFPNTLADNQAGNDALLKANSLYFLFSAVIFAPMIEETVFRGCIFAKMREKHSFLVSACVSGAVFGFLHIVASILVGNWMNCIYFIVYAACGFVLCIPYEDTGSIFASIHTHATNNFILTIVRLWMNSLH